VVHATARRPKRTWRSLMILAAIPADREKRAIPMRRKKRSDTLFKRLAMVAYPK
jgi:hypothetical protein